MTKPNYQFEKRKKELAKKKKKEEKLKKKSGHAAKDTPTEQPAIPDVQSTSTDNNT